jgi:PTS system nitrogen regulatory IIA component
MSADAKASAFPVALYSLLDEGLVVRDSDAQSKDELVRRLALGLGKRVGLAAPDAALAKVLERESGISTTLDTGLSLPHARLDAMKSFAATLALLPKGLPDPQQPDLSIRAVLLFFSPNEPAFFQKHLQFLRHVATLFQPAFIDQLLACPGPKEVIEALKAKES